MRLVRCVAVAIRIKLAIITGVILSPFFSTCPIESFRQTWKCHIVRIHTFLLLQGLWWCVKDHNHTVKDKTQPAENKTKHQEVTPPILQLTLKSRVFVFYFHFNFFFLYFLHSPYVYIFYIFCWIFLFAFDFSSYKCKLYRAILPQAFEMNSYTSGLAIIWLLTMWPLSTKHWLVCHFRCVTIIVTMLCCFKKAAVIQTWKTPLVKY